jgi:hypothetical protein
MISPVHSLQSFTTEDGSAILDVEHDRMITLNSIGGFIWNRLQRGQTVEDIVLELANETGMDTSAIEVDVRAFIDELKTAGLLKL